MAWRVVFAPLAEKSLAPLDDPRTKGTPLVGEKYAGQWRYRVGDYRIIARIEYETVTITVIRVGHRREIYR
jgi:mRNA interferase RelE/StbE